MSFSGLQLQSLWIIPTAAVSYDTCSAAVQSMMSKSLDLNDPFDDQFYFKNRGMLATAEIISVRAPHNMDCTLRRWP